MVKLSAVYFPPKYKLTMEDYTEFFKSLGNKSLVGGDYNAKYGLWGSKTISPRGKILEQVIQKLHLNVLTTGELLY